MYQSRTERAVVDVVAANSDEAEEFGTRMAYDDDMPTPDWSDVTHKSGEAFRIDEAELIEDAEAA
jgi:hypothetical protein